MSRHVVTRRRRVFGVWFISCVVTRHADPSSSVRRSSSTHVQGRPSTDRTTRMSENPTPQNHSRRSWTSQPSIVVYNVRESHNPERRARRPTSSTTSTARARRPRRRAIAYDRGREASIASSSTRALQSRSRERVRRRKRTNVRHSRDRRPTDDDDDDDAPRRGRHVRAIRIGVQRARDRGRSRSSEASTGVRDRACGDRGGERKRREENKLR